MNEKYCELLRVLRHSMLAAPETAYGKLAYQVHSLADVFPQCMQEFKRAQNQLADFDIPPSLKTLEEIRDLCIEHLIVALKEQEGGYAELIARIEEMKEGDEEASAAFKREEEQACKVWKGEIL